MLLQFILPLFVDDFPHITPAHLDVVTSFSAVAFHRAAPYLNPAVTSPPPSAFLLALVFTVRLTIIIAVSVEDKHSQYDLIALCK